MEMAYNAKHDAREAATTQDEEGVDLQDKLKEINKKMDLRKKQGLKELKKKLSDIISDESLHASARGAQGAKLRPTIGSNPKLLRW